jgi:hypothetical protein
MAAPTFRAAGARSDGIGAAANTPGAPAGIATGDLEFLIAGTNDGNTIAITADGGGAWSTVIASISVTNGSRIYCWYRIRAGGDGDPTLAASAGHSMVSRFCYQTGTFDTADPLEAEASGSDAASDTSFSAAPGTSTSGSDRIVVCFGGGRRDSLTSNFTTLANATLSSLAHTNVFGTTAGAGNASIVTRGTLASAGSVGTFSGTVSVSTPDTWISFAIKPVAVVPSTVKNLAALGVG